VVNLNGVEGEGFKAIEDLSLVFSPDSKRLAYKATSGTKELIVLDGKKTQKYAAAGYPIFTPDSRHLGYAAADNKGWHLAIDQKLGSPYDQILNRNKLRFESSGTLSFVAIRKDEAFRVQFQPAQ